MPTIIANIKAATQSITSWQDAVPQWRYPCIFENERAELFKRCDDFRAACKEARFHVGALLGQAADDKHESTQAQDSWRKARNRFRTWWLDRDVPPAVARIAADRIQSNITNPIDVGIKLLVSSPELTMSGEVTAATFQSPFQVRKVVSPSTDAKDICSKLSFLYADNHDSALTRMAQCKTHMVRDGKVCAMGTVSLKNDLTITNAAGEEVIRNEAKELQMMVTGMWGSVCDGPLEAIPLQGHASFYMQITREAIYIVVPPETVQETPDVQAWLVSADPSALQSCKAFWAKEGDAVWVPMGHVCLHLGLTPSVGWSSEKAKLPDMRTKAGAVQKHCMCYAQVLVHVTYSIQHLSGKLRLLLASNYVKAGSKVPESYKKVAAFTKFIESLGLPVQQANELDN